MPYICASGISTSLIWLASSRSERAPDRAGAAGNRRRAVPRHAPCAPCSTSWRNWLMFSYSSASTSPRRATSGIETPGSCRSRYGLGRECHDRPGNREGCRPGSGKRFSCHRREHAYQRAGNAEFGERLGAFLLARLIEIGGEGIFIFNHSGIGHNGLSCQTLRTLRKLLTVAHARYFCLAVTGGRRYR